MHNNDNICHDLKSDRPDIGQPLPAVLAFLPILFVLAVVGAIALNILFFFQLKSAETAKEEWKEKSADEVTQQQQIGAKIKAIRVEEKRATDVRNWVEGSRELQPLAVTIARSMDEFGSNIAELSLFRDIASADQVRIGLKYDTDRSNVAKQLDATLAAVGTLGYRAYSANQTKGKGSGALDYQATLIWQPRNKEDISLTTNE